MLGWALGFFVAAVAAAMFGFGVIASTFAGVAMLLFWVFVGLTIVSLLLSLVGGKHVEVAGGSHAAGGGPSFGGLAAIGLVAAFAVLAYAWVQNDWSAERAGRAIDQHAAHLTADASQALFDAGERAEALIENTGAQMREDAGQGLDQAHDLVEPDDERP